MKDRAFHFEIRDLLTQFIAAFDDVVIGRYNKTRTEMAQIKVRYVYAPKERVLFDIVNKAQNITLPVIAITLTGITRDESRVFNKGYGFDVAARTATDKPASVSNHVGMPVPVNIGVSMSIIANYQTDIDQILSNFIPYNNPYVIISWKIPSAFNLAYEQEIRSEVLWDSNISLKYPTEITSSDKFRVEADTSFTIKGWLFPEAPADPLKNIFFIDSNFHASRILDSSRFQGYETYYTLSGSSVTEQLSSYNLSESETVSVSAAPTITNLYFAGNNTYRPVHGENLIITPQNKSGKFLIQGKRFQYTTNVLLSSTSNIYTALTSLSFDYYSTLSAHVLPTSSYQVLNENTISLTLPTGLSYGTFDIIVQDVVGWDTTAKEDCHIVYHS